MGHQLNPRWGKFDFKFFFEVRPGLIGWVGKTYYFTYQFVICIYNLYVNKRLYAKCVIYFVGTPEC